MVNAFKHGVLLSIVGVVVMISVWTFGGGLNQNLIGTVNAAEVQEESLYLTPTGVTWFGFETKDKMLHGLWTGRSVPDFMDQIKSLGFSSIRIPLTGNILDNEALGLAAYITKSGYPDRTLDALNYVINEAREKSLGVLLVYYGHEPVTPPGTPPPGTPVYMSFDEAYWLSRLRGLAMFASSHTNVVGIAPWNEPHALSWSQWKTYVENAAEAILLENPVLKIYVQGIFGEVNGNWSYWGENLSGVYSDPPDIAKLPLDNTVFSVHTYSPSENPDNDLFKDPSYPNNLPSAWDSFWGELHSMNYSIALGEYSFGTELDVTDKEKQWYETLSKYAKGKGVTDAYYYSLNPNNGTVGGVLASDWRTPTPRVCYLFNNLDGCSAQ